jgi:drug/metabolite transporter (DMT)-like permease
MRLMRNPRTTHHEHWTGEMSRAGALRLGTLALLWGSSFLFIKVSLDGLSPIQIVLVRMCTGALVLGLFVAVAGEALPRRPAVWAHVAVAAIVANLIPYFLFAWGEQRVDSAVAGTLNATTPLFTMALALTSRTEPLRTHHATGLTVGFLGALLIIAPWGETGGSARGALACLAAAISYAVSYVYMHRYLTGRGHSPLALATAQITAGALMIAAAAPFIAHQGVHLTTPVVAGVLALGALGTGLAYILNYRLIQDQGATIASSVTYLLPIVAVILGAIILGEPITWTLAAGTATVLIGIAISNAGPRSAQTAADTQ